LQQDRDGIRNSKAEIENRVVLCAFPFMCRPTNCSFILAKKDIRQDEKKKLADVLRC
jgi:hypothetical protein